MTARPSDKGEGLKLTKAEITALRWSQRCNRDGIGFLGPTVRRIGPLPLYERLVAARFLRVVELGFGGNDKQLGYFITPAGRQALETSHDR